MRFIATLASPISFAGPMSPTMPGTTRLVALGESAMVRLRLVTPRLTNWLPPGITRAGTVSASIHFVWSQSPCRAKPPGTATSAVIETRYPFAAMHGLPVVLFF